MRNMINEVKVEGFLYETKVEKKTSQKGVEYIGGSLSIAIDEDCKNIVDVYYPYVVPTFKSGSPNRTYDFLNSLIDHPEYTVLGAGVSGAIRVSTSGCSINLNEWYDQQGELVSRMRNEGGFINRTSAVSSKPNFFKTDIVVTNVSEDDGDGEDIKTTVKGAIFGYKNALLPVTFVAYGTGPNKYFTSLDATASTPVLTTVWGDIVATEFKNEVETENAFGETLIEETVKTRKEYVITGAKEALGFDTEDSILASDLEKLSQERQVHLAEMKQRADEYKASKDNAAPAATPVSSGDFKF